MEKHAARAVLDDDRHGTGRCRASEQLGNRLASGIAGEFFDVDGVKDLKTDGMAHRLVSGLHTAVAVGHCADAEQGADNFVCCEDAVGVCDEGALRTVAITSRHLDNLGTVRACCFVHPLQQFDLAGFGDALGKVNDRVRAVDRRLGK